MIVVPLYWDVQIKLLKKAGKNVKPQERSYFLAKVVKSNIRLNFENVWQQERVALPGEPPHLPLYNLTISICKSSFSVQLYCYTKAKYLVTLVRSTKLRANLFAGPGRTELVSKLAETRQITAIGWGGATRGA